MAGVYGERANAHANERYRLECLHWLAGCRRVLDAGCGTAAPLADLRAHIPVVGIDLTEAMLAAGPGRGRVAAARAEQLPFESGAFDGVYSINLLEHVSNPVRSVCEMARVLAPGGRLVLVTPAAEWETLLNTAERLKIKLPEGPHRFLTRGELAGAVRAAGLALMEYRRMLIFPIGGKRAARATRFAEQWTRGIGTLHLLAAERR